MACVHANPILEEGTEVATINQIPMTIMGNITADLEPKRTGKGTTVVNFRVAQTSSTDKNGRWEDGETTYIRCVAFGALADHMISSGMRKGTRIVATGRFVQRDYQNEAGDTRHVYELNVDDLGASVRYATVQIAKASNASRPEQQNIQTAPGNSTADVWSSASDDVFANPMEPMI